MKPSWDKTLTAEILKKVLLKRPLLMAGLVAMVVLVVGLSLVPALLLRHIVDFHLVPRRVEGLLQVVCWYGAVVVAIGALDFGKGSLLSSLGQGMIYEMRMAMTEKLGRIRATYFTENPSGAITSRIINDVENVNTLFSEGLISLMIDALKIVGIIWTIACFSGPLSLVACGLVPFIFLVTRAFQRRMLKAQLENLEQVGQVNTHIGESLKNRMMIKSFNREDYMAQVYKGRLMAQFHTMTRVNFYDSCFAPVIQVTRALVIAGIVLASRDGLMGMGLLPVMSLGMVAASIELISNLFQPIESLGMELQNIQKGTAGLKRIHEFYRESEQVPQDPAITLEGVLGAKGGPVLKFEGVSFSYEADVRVIEDFTLTLERGQSTTIVGRTGIGKTTLFKLTMGLLEPQRGSITLGGYQVHRLPSAIKRKLFGYVPQDFSFVEGTICDQISLGDPQITQDQVVGALTFVGLYDKVAAMDKGLMTPMMENNRCEFSQGEKQLLTIARALVANPLILLLDEITANLDVQTEARILGVIKEASLGRTVLSISHRSAR